MESSKVNYLLSYEDKLFDLSKKYNCPNTCDNKSP